MEEKTKRNKQIVEDKKKMSYRELSIKYNLSVTRLQEIIKREQQKYGSRTA